MQHLIAPSKTISKKAITLWRITNSISFVISIMVLGTLLFMANYYEWFEWIKVIIYVAFAYAIIKSGIFNIFIKPIYLQKTWRYEVDEQFVQIKSGYLQRHHTIIPTSRIEYVVTDQGPLLRKFQLSQITIGTIASSHIIPALPNDEAENLKMKIAHLAQIVTEDIQENEVIISTQGEMGDSND